MGVIIGCGNRSNVGIDIVTLVWFPEFKEATLNTIVPNNVRVSI
jgi:hypothetical protein